MPTILGIQRSFHEMLNQIGLGLRICRQSAVNARGSPHHGVSLLCHVSRSGELQVLDFLVACSECLPCGMVNGKSLMLLAIVVENPFRSPNGRSVEHPQLNNGKSPRPFGGIPAVCAPRW
jgi:hypothetical protein